MYSIICIHRRLHRSNSNKNLAFPAYMKQLVEYNGKTTSDKQPRKNMTTIGKVDTSDLIMMIRRWLSNITTKHELASCSHATFYIAKKIQKVKQLTPLLFSKNTCTWIYNSAPITNINNLTGFNFTHKFTIQKQFNADTFHMILCKKFIILSVDLDLDKLLKHANIQYRL